MDRHCIYSVPRDTTDVVNSGVCRTFFPIKVEDHLEKDKRIKKLFPMDKGSTSGEFSQEEGHLLLSKPHGVGAKIKPDNLKIVVFGLFNIAKDANDTIINKYKDINDVKRRFYKIKETFKYADKKQRATLIGELKGLLKHSVTQNINKQAEAESPAPAPAPRAAASPAPAPSAAEYDETVGDIRNFDIYIDVKKHIDETNNNNSVTALGTLEFMNEILSFLMTDWTCEVNIDNINKYNDQCLKNAGYNPINPSAETKPSSVNGGSPLYNNKPHTTQRTNRRLRKTTVKKLR
jgi:hypothetical protein